ncbi:MAG: HNH endonuclease signature motif containing protein [Bacillota bacterium]
MGTGAGHRRRVYHRVRYRPIPKPIRIKDPEAIESARRPHCEYCGHPGRREGEIHVHHVRSRGAGGHDCQENLVSLCWLCHDGVHRGRIPRARIEALVGARELLRGQIGTLACVCGDTRLIWLAAQGVFRCYKCDEVIGPNPRAASSSPPGRG